MDMDSYVVIVVLFGLIGPSVGEYCTERYHGVYGRTTRTIHCSFGCCGSYYDQYCCVSSTGFIVGLVFAGIFTLAVIIAVVCCCIKHKGSRGRVIQPSGTTATTTHHNQVFIVPTGSSPPAYSTVYSTPGSNVYPPLPAYYPIRDGFGAPMPPAYSTAPAPPPAYSAAGPGPKFPQQEQPNPFAAAAGTGGN